MPDVKKLITGFLILAAGASSSALILSNISSANPAASAPSAQTAAIAQQQPTLTGNAFADDSNDPTISSDPTQVSTTTQAQLNDPTNLTNNLADAFINNLVAANPDGGQTDATGDTTVLPPDNEAIITQLAQAPGAATVDFPNWDTEVAEVEGKITTSNSSDPNDNAQYIAGLKNIFDQYFVQPDLQDMLSNENPDPSASAVAGQQIQSAIQASVSLQTPAAAASFQKSLIKVFVYEKNILALVQNASNDPVKTGLVFQAEEAKYNSALQDLQTQMQKASALGIMFTGKSENTGLGFVDTLLGIQTAHAIFGIGDITFDPAVFGQMLLNYAKDTVLQVLKTVVMALIQQKVLSWIQGSGAPRFIENWGTTIVNSYATAANNALNAQFACIPSAMLPSLRILLSTPSVSGGSNSCSAQFQSQLGNNLTNFYNHFSNGGFNSYLSLFQPGGNAFGAIIDIQDNTMAAGANSQQATVAQSTAAQGYKSSQVCADGSNPAGTHTVCLDSHDIAYHTNANGSCDAGLFPSLQSNGGACANGATPQVTQPGNVANQAFGVALDTNPKLVAGANTIAGLLNSFLSSLLNTLATAAITYSKQVVLQATSPSAGSPPSDGGITNAGTLPVPATPAAAEPPVQCQPANQIATYDPTSGQVSADFYGQGGATAADGSDPTYSWSAPGASSATGGTDTGTPFTATYNASGTYNVTVTASTDNTTSNCTVTVQ